MSTSASPFALPSPALSTFYLVALFLIYNGASCS